MICVAHISHRFVFAALQAWSSSDLTIAHFGSHQTPPFTIFWDVDVSMGSKRDIVAKEAL
jgi:hypothetical protein